MSAILYDAINSVIHSEIAFCKFLSANDTGKTGGHQAGIYIPKTSITLLFDKPFQKGENHERWAKITWQNELVTTSRFIYYGCGTRNEYRITNFGKGFPYLTHDHTGDLIIICKHDQETYDGWCLSTEDDIDEFLESFNISPLDTNRLINKTSNSMKVVEAVIKKHIEKIPFGFPETSEVSALARLIYDWVNPNGNKSSTILAIRNPDDLLLKYTDYEYALFKELELKNHGFSVKNGFSSFDDFLELANQILNRRKSRAGKSLEHHLCSIFDANRLQYENQVRTEGKKRPDFIFPSGDAYHNILFPVNDLISLAAKTTCKDRWRQILNEADRLKDRPKYLCTLQHGISADQIQEMTTEKVVLVVPKSIIGYYPQEMTERIWTLGKFIHHVYDVQNK